MLLGNSKVFTSSSSDMHDKLEALMKGIENINQHMDATNQRLELLEQYLGDVIIKPIGIITARDRDHNDYHRDHNDRHRDESVHRSRYIDDDVIRRIKIDVLYSTTPTVLMI